MTKSEERLKDIEICMHYREVPNSYNGAVIPPTFSNTLFIYPTFEELGKAVSNEQEHFVYTRGTNPTVHIAEQKLAELERGEACKCFASGMAAISAALVHSLKSGDHVLCISNVYFSSMDLLIYMEKFNVSHSVIYSTDIAAIEQALLPTTKVIYLECPTDHNFRLVDLKALACLAKNKGIRTIIDNTWATPLFQKPLTHGIDIVVHSTSKYLGGHSDLMGGAVISNKQIISKLFTDEFILFGGIMPPREASQLLRSLRTLPIRMATHEANALKVAKFLESHSAVEAVHYPGLPSHPDYGLGQRQLTGYSGLLSFTLKNATYETVKEVINKAKVFQIGVSWGSFESLIMSPNYGNNADQLKEEHTSPGLIRISVGQGDADELIQDLKQALE
ncbi:trans-sulfuration enzyme family protein [Terribacillus saccharophilus]|uniref:trans-sulfuration enzyme family protein n=1 Tax=Terribacillus saccharophilus TaxID=361277 RepID=UPI000BA64960|nr:aminotransferase class I/II-fold pyridoxal phosphate-dependent enzyme [Terribacillus saccharophilus]PAF19260.1 methionine gamma-lyase [Terribacillus saccharophilus]